MLYQGEAYRGDCASKKRYFYGIKVHFLVTRDGQPVEVFLTPGAFAVVNALPGFAFDLPAGATIYANHDHNDYGFVSVTRFSPLFFNAPAGSPDSVFKAGIWQSPWSLLKWVAKN